MRRFPTNRTRTVVVATVAAVAIGGGAFAATAGKRSSGHYRTSTAAYRSVVETMDEVGTIEPVAHANVAFPVAGDVATIEVHVGDTVTAGQVLATLDPAALQAALREAQAALDQAELTLERALDGEVVGGNGSGAPNGIGVASTASASIELLSAQTASVTDEELRAAQRAVLDAQRQVDADLIAAEEALDAAQQACSTEDEPPTTTTSTTSTTAPASPNSQAGICYDALEAALAAQQQLSSSQQALSEAASRYDALLAERSSELGSSPPSDGPDGSGGQGGTGNGPPDGGTPSTGGTPSGGDTAPGATSGTGDTSAPSSERLTAYQSAIDAAAVEVTVAEAALDQAAIVSPFDGQVVTVDIAPGDEVTAASDTATIGIDAAGGFEVTPTVSVADLPDLEIGQVATVTPDGADLTLAGEVVSIGLTASSGTTGTTYPLTISLRGDTDGLRRGSVASIAITLAEGDDVLAVPTSAVHADGGDYTVSLLDGNATATVRVEVGAIGATWTEIRSGLSEGATVVLADLDEPLPGSATDAGSSGAGQTGPFGGGGFPLPPGS